MSNFILEKKKEVECDISEIRLKNSSIYLDQTIVIPHFYPRRHHKLNIGSTWNLCKIIAEDKVKDIIKNTLMIN